MAKIATELLPAARAHVRDVERRIAALRKTIEAGEMAEAELAARVAGPDGADELAAVVGGAENALAGEVDRAHRAACAARAARAALAVAEQDLSTARAEVDRLEQARDNQAAAVALSSLDFLGAAYIKAFRELGEIHDQLLGAAQGLRRAGAGDVILIEGHEIEIARFHLPSMPAGEVYSHYLKHTPDAQTVSAASVVWDKFVAQLRRDPSADVAALLRPELLDQVGTAWGANARTIEITRKPPLDEGVDVNSALYGPAHPAPARTMRILGAKRT